MKTKKRYTTYWAGAIESVTNKEMSTWRDELTLKLSSPDLLIYDPVRMEADKVGKPSGEQVKYITGLKQSGHWDKFYDEMQKIWWGNVVPDSHIMELFMAMRTESILHGNSFEEMKDWGDYEAVAKSNFIVIYWPKDTKTVGTTYEAMLAFLLHIPIYLILPDMPKTDCNSSLIYGVMISGGEIYYSLNDCAKAIREKYKLTQPEEKKE